MKKTIFAAVALLCLCGTAVAQRHIEFRWHGLYCVGDASFAFNVNRSADEVTGIGDTVAGFMPSISAGYQFRKGAAVGLGFSYLADPTGAFTQLPVFFELRSHFSRAQLTPYSVLQIGYTLPLGSSSEPPSTKIEEGGLYLGLEVGGRYAFSRSFALGLHGGYKLLYSNKVQRTDALNNPILSESVALSMLCFGVSAYLGGD
ncbi:MAG: hypothetical protein J6X51_02650 [Bacteroidales bacterium]|nr:hypothetical protein [Bacteroidales bacterium]